VFGELTYHFTPKLALTVGLRELYASQNFTRPRGRCSGRPDNTPGYDGQPPIREVDGDDAQLQAELGRSQPDVSVYANASKGFRLGGANRPVPDTPRSSEPGRSWAGLQRYSRHRSSPTACGATSWAARWICWTTP
jgi:outer membrane receptor protein involved in Fe transport